MTGDIILKIVNAGAMNASAKADLSVFGKIAANAKLHVLSGKPDDKNSFQNPEQVKPVISEMVTRKMFTYNVPPYSVSVIRIAPNKK